MPVRAAALITALQAPQLLLCARQRRHTRVHSRTHRMQAHARRIHVQQHCQLSHVRRAHGCAALAAGEPAHVHICEAVTQGYGCMWGTVGVHTHAARTCSRTFKRSHACSICWACRQMCATA